MKPRYRIKAPSRPHPHLTIVPFARAPAIDPYIALALSSVASQVEKYQSIAIATVNRDGTLSSAYVIGPDLFKLLGSLRNVTMRIENEISRE